MARRKVIIGHIHLRTLLTATMTVLTRYIYEYKEDMNVMEIYQYQLGYGKSKNPVVSEIMRLYISAGL